MSWAEEEVERQHAQTDPYSPIGFIAGIPAVAWMMAYLLGIVLLRAGRDQTATQIA
jgi:hypothetical protein